MARSRAVNSFPDADYKYSGWEAVAIGTNSWRQAQAEGRRRRRERERVAIGSLDVDETCSADSSHRVHAAARPPASSPSPRFMAEPPLLPPRPPRSTAPSVPPVTFSRPLPFIFRLTYSSQHSRSLWHLNSIVFPVRGWCSHFDLGSVAAVPLLDVGSVLARLHSFISLLNPFRRFKFQANISFFYISSEMTDSWF